MKKKNKKMSLLGKKSAEARKKKMGSFAFNAYMNKIALKGGKASAAVRWPN